MAQRRGVSLVRLGDGEGAMLAHADPAMARDYGRRVSVIGCRDVAPMLAQRCGIAARQWLVRGEVAFSGGARRRIGLMAIAGLEDVAPGAGQSLLRGGAEVWRWIWAVRSMVGPG